MRVIVLGGGVAGMSAAHELAERGFDVLVFEARPAAGGKARSFPFPGSAGDGRPALPGEHGFRFFPGFYRHLPHTMRRIPYGRDGRNVFENLVTATEAQIARADGPELLSPAHLPRNLRDLDKAFRFVADYAGSVGIGHANAAYFLNRLLLLLTSCEERRFAEFENQSWWEFSGASARGGAYAKYLADGLTRTLVAARAREMSARTGGYILLQLLFDLTDPTGQVDRVLNGPTSDVWIDPWLEHLKGMGVDFRTGHQVQAIHCGGGRVSGVTVVADGVPSTHTADWYVAALPVEVMRLLIGEQLMLADPRLAGLHRLRTRWMNGIVYYLDRDVRAVHGHTVYIDSQWALTSISQPQFWQARFQPERLGDGRARGILSVDVSDWEAIGSGIRKQAMYCSREEIEAEVWHQLKESLDEDATRELDGVDVLAAFLDPSIVHPNPTEAANLEPLLVNTVGSWRDRPDAETEVDNLLLASDYVRTHTDLATMEGANEAARRAVNAILRRTGSDAEPCGVWPLREPPLFAPARALDRVLFKLGRPPRQQVRIDDGRVRAAPYLPLAEKWTGSWAPRALKIFGE
ncbi:MAG TPA: FAD-dependent oxidoreductase [Thermoleophilaceae bacterium]|nr:FAD-dependent oxidoreductase [Thermoleophilaceae bacterium]